MSPCRVSGARVTEARIRRRTMRLATASASPLGSTFFSNCGASLPRSRTRRAARRSLNYNPLFRAGACL